MFREHREQWSPARESLSGHTSPATIIPGTEELPCTPSLPDHWTAEWFKGLPGPAIDEDHTADLSLARETPPNFSIGDEKASENRSDTASQDDAMDTSVSPKPSIQG